MIGALLQLAALCCEGLRLCLVNVLLASRGLKLSSIANLFYIAPTCFLCLLGPWAIYEARAVLADNAATMRRVGFATLLANSSVASPQIHDTLQRVNNM